MLSWFKKKDAAPVVVVETAPAAEAEDGWLNRLSTGLAKSTAKLTGGLTDFVTKRKLDEAAIELLEEALIAADLGPTLASQIAADFGRQRFGQDVGDVEIKNFLADAIAAKLQAVAQPLAVDPARAPFVILMVGVNGSGKTTTLGKLAAQFKAEGKRVRLVAGDTFRAAAVEQLQGWGQRAQVEVVAGQPEADAAGLAFDALTAAKRDGVEVLLVDTAGRLQNKAGLMAELGKIVRALHKADGTAPHATLLTLDATTGQNALSQAKLFGETTPLTGLCVTKLDGTAKGGIVVALADQFKLPIVAVGVGEGVADLQPFDAQAFAQTLVGLSPAA